MYGISTGISLSFPRATQALAVSLHMPYGANAVCHTWCLNFCCCPFAIPECIPRYVASLASTK